MRNTSGKAVYKFGLEYHRTEADDVIGSNSWRGLVQRFPYILGQILHVDVGIGQRRA